MKETVPITSSDVVAVFDSYPAAVRRELLVLRQLILDTANETDGVGAIEETPKWGQPSYLTSETGSGSTIRIAPAGPRSGFDYGMFFICHTNLVTTFKELFGDRFVYDGNPGVAVHDWFKDPRRRASRMCRYGPDLPFRRRLILPGRARAGRRVIWARACAMLLANETSPVSATSDLNHPNYLRPCTGSHMSWGRCTLLLLPTARRRTHPKLPGLRLKSCLHCEHCTQFACVACSTSIYRLAE